MSTKGMSQIMNVCDIRPYYFETSHYKFMGENLNPSRAISPCQFYVSQGLRQCHGQLMVNSSWSLENKSIRSMISQKSNPPCGVFLIFLQSVGR